MITVLGYELHEKMRYNHNIDTYYALRLKDRCKVLLKIPNNNVTSSENVAILQHEFHLLKTINTPSIIKAYDFLQSTPAPVLILEHVEGALLSSFLVENTLEISDFFDLALQLVDILGELHQRNIIHKEIRPTNIIIDPQQLALKLIDLSASTQLSEELFDYYNLSKLGDSLAYISPEQTGRINRPVDYRTDFYSLGITFYEMLTNQVPFQTMDSLDLIESHISKKPISVLTARRNIPKMLAAIIDKLLEKMPEDRYSSFIGIKSDLLDCFKQWVVKRNLTEYSLGSKDIRDHLSISRNLYGREHEVKQLIEAFYRVSQSTSEIIFIAGYSGIGKTSIVKEVYKPIVEHRGYFIQGKFDQLRRSMPYSAIVTAFQNLVKQVLSENEEKVDVLKNQLIHSLGTVSQVVIDVIPDVELIIGKQSPAHPLNPADAKIRFNLVFQNFVRVFAREEHPLVIFLDDLQWADKSSLGFIENLLQDHDTKYLLIIGAYRDNEINAHHQLQLSLNNLSLNQVASSTLILQPLQLNNVQQLLQDALSGSLEKIQSLAECVYDKTQGNPFFINEFLKLIYQQKLLTFSYELGAWEWDLDEIKRQSANDTIINLINAKIHLLSKPTQETLKLASCLGHQFDFKTLLVISGQTTSNSAEQLAQAISAHLIYPLEEAYQTLGLVGLEEASIDFEMRNLHYRFAHDKIQQAAYDLIEQEYRLEIHLKIGRLLLKQKPLEEHDERLFRVLKHFNQSIALIDDIEERHLLAKYNFWAGQKAKMEAAYDAANEHLSAAVEFLEPINWGINSGLIFQIYKECAVCKYLIGDFTSADRFFSELLNQSRCATDKLEIYRLKIEMLSTLGKHTEALQMGLLALREFNIKIPEYPNVIHILIAIYKIKFQLRNTRIEELYLPPMNDLQQKAIVDLITQLLNSAFIIDQKLFVIFTCKNISLSLKYGYTESTSMSIPVYAFIIMHSLNLYDEAISFVSLYNRLKQEYGASNFEGKNQFILGTFIEPYQTSFTECNTTVNNAFKLCCDVGDLVYSNYSKLLLVLHSMSAANSLEEVKQSVESALSFMTRVKISDFITVAKFWKYYVHCLENSEQGTVEQSVLFEEEIIAGKSKTELGFFYSSLTRLHFLLGNFSEAVKSGEQHEVYSDYDKGMISHLDGKLFFALALFYYLPQAPKGKKRYYLRKLKRLRLFIDKYANWCPENYKVYSLLIASEFACIEGQHEAALGLYEQSINLAQTNGLLLIAAIASERAAIHCLDIKVDRMAKFYLRNAHRCFKEWGAVTKVKLLEEAHPALLLNYDIPAHNVVLSSSSQPSANTKSLDMLAILKCTQRISGEIRLDKLLQKLLIIVLELTGAQRGVFLVRVKDKWIIKADGNLSSQTIYLNGVMAAEVAQRVPESLLNHIDKAHKPIILKDAIKAELTAEDLYVHHEQPDALLMMPLFHNGQMDKILYLEHKNNGAAFTAEHISCLFLLTDQVMALIENAEAFYQVTHDVLTGLANRNMLYELFELNTKQLARSEITVTLISIDIDAFKQINDSFGVDIGEKVLVHIAHVLTSNLRKGEVSARIGGDEFVVMLVNVGSNREITKVAERLLNELVKPASINDHLIDISISMGISIYPHDGNDIQILLKLAEKALNRAKEHGGKQFQFYTVHYHDGSN